MYWSAFIIGLFGSLHCIGMCGPIAMALPIPRESRIFGAVFYNLGRTLTYMFLGLILGSIGYAVQLSGYQHILSIFIGVLILLYLIIPRFIKKYQSHYYNSLWMRWVKNKIGFFFKKKTMPATFMVGILNGFLPCGLIYAAIAGSLVTATYLEGALYMSIFSLGTMPMMFFAFLIPMIKQSSKFKLQKVIPVFMACLALLFIYRGVAIELPLIDPMLESAGFGKITTCGPI